MGESEDEINNNHSTAPFAQGFAPRRRERQPPRERDEYVCTRDREPWKIKRNFNPYGRNYSRSPGRYRDNSPGQFHNKRVRRDWDSQEPFGYNVTPYSDFLNRDEHAGGTNAALLSFKAFLAEQEDNITDNDAVARYGQYKLDFRRQQISDFFITHKEEEWFRWKYDSTEQAKQYEEQRSSTLNRLAVFTEMVDKKVLEGVAVDMSNCPKLTHFLDAVLIKLEGGTDFDLTVLDSENNVKVQADDANTNTRSNGSTMAKKKPDKSEETAGAAITSLSDSEDEVSSEGEVTSEKEEQKPIPYHKTASIFLRSLPSSVSKQDIENLCKNYEGFRRIVLDEPSPDRRFHRRGWITFDASRASEMKTICWELNNSKSFASDIGAIVNRELSRRIRPVDAVTNYSTVMRNDVKIARLVIRQLDKKWKMWALNEDSPGEHQQELNPVLKDSELVLRSDEKPGDDFAIADDQLRKVLDKLVLYLRVVHSVDFYNAVEYHLEDFMPNRCGIMHARALLNDASALPPATPATEPVDENCKAYFHLCEKRNQLKECTQQYIDKFNMKMNPFMLSHDLLDLEMAKSLGLKDVDEEIERFISQNTVKVTDEKWTCPLSGKKFKGAEFVRKHIFNKHQTKIDEVRREIECFNNYVRDPKRPQLQEQIAIRHMGMCAFSYSVPSSSMMDGCGSGARKNLSSSDSQSFSSHSGSLSSQNDRHSSWTSMAHQMTRRHATGMNNAVSGGRRATNNGDGIKEREAVKYDINYADMENSFDF